MIERVLRIVQRPLDDLPQFKLWPGDIVVATRDIPSGYKSGLDKPILCGTRGTVRFSFFSMEGIWYRIHWDPGQYTREGFNYLQGDHEVDDVGYSLDADGTDAKWRRKQYD